MFRLPLVATCVALLFVACAPNQEADDYSAKIRRSSFGVAHIEASDLASLGFGEGYAQAEDHLCSLADQVVQARGERAKYFGAGPENAHLNGDIGIRALRIHEGAGEELANYDDTYRGWYQGYVDGYNQYLAEVGRDNVPGWCRGAEWVVPISAQDLAAYHRMVTLVASRFATWIATATPPVTSPEAEAVSASLEENAITDLGASNGWAIGSELSENGRGMLIANPHYPWVGSNRFWEKHLRIPGEFDVYGVGLIGIPGVAIGFNRAVAWTHTVSAGVRYTLYAMDLVEGSPTTYRYGDEQREMTTREVTVEVLGEDGAVGSENHTVYFTHHGPVLDFPNVGWSEQTVLAIRDANEFNDESRQQWLDMNRAQNLDEFKAAHANNQGMPWVNTIAATAEGEAWYADTSSTPNLSPEAIEAWKGLRESHPLIGGMYGEGIVVLPGGDPLFEWQDDEAARDPGVVAYSDMPQITRRDYVFNANDSFWMANSSALLEGDYSPLHGAQNTARSLRTRNNDLTLSGRSPDDPNGDDDKFSLEEMSTALLSNRSYTAELLKPELVAACKKVVDLREACRTLESWNNRFDLDAHGAPLFREWIGQYPPSALQGRGELFARDFDPADPVNTPAGLANPRDALQKLARAAEILRSAGHPIDTPLGHLQYAPSKLPERMPVHGGHGAYEGVMNMQQASPNRTTLEPMELGDRIEGSRFLTTEGYPIGHGSSFLMALEYTDDGPRAQAFLTYGQSGDPTSPHFRDQTRLYAEKEWRPILFEEEAIAANVQSEKVVTGRRE